MIWHPHLLCAGSCAGQETCSRAWRKNHHSSPGLRLRPGPNTGEGRAGIEDNAQGDSQEEKESKGLVEMNKHRHAGI